MEKMKFSVDVTSVNDYINEVGTGEIIAKLAASAPSLQYFAHQGQVNAPTDIHMLEIEGAFGDGRSCEVLDNTTFTFTDRQLVPAYLKMDVTLCKADLIGKWMLWKDRFTASNEDYPFGQFLVEQFGKTVAKNLEAWIWNGGTIGSDTYKGFATLIAEDGNTVKAGENASVYDMIVAGIKAASDDARANTEFFISEANMIALKEELLAKDFRLFDLTFSNGTEVDAHTIKMPIFGNLVHAVAGLSGDNNVYGLVPEHAVYGYSVEGAHTDIREAVDPMTKKHLLSVELVAAMQIAYPDETMVIKAEDIL